MFANVIEDNFVNFAVNGRAYNNYVNDRAKAFIKRDNKCKITISDVELAIGKLNKTASQDCNQLTIMHFL